MGHKDYIEELIADNRIEQAIREIRKGAKMAGDDRLSRDTLSLLGRFNGNEDAKNGGGQSAENYKLISAQIINSLNSYLADYNPPDGITWESGGVTPTPTPTGGGAGGPAKGVKPTVFISYSHSDVAMAQKMKNRLEQADVEVFIDSEQLDAGGNIADFIQEMINKTDTTISLVSTRSLMSGWVGLESVMSLMHEYFKEDKKFIACAIDLEFFNDDFVYESLLKINEKVSEYGEKIDKIKAINSAISTKDLENKRDAQQKLLIAFPDIIDRLNQNYTIDISNDEKFETGVGLVIKALKE